MFSSVSSKHTFLQGGITISNYCSCLKGDIVEALQCLKCAIRHELLFQEPAPSLLLEVEETSDEELGGPEEEPNMTSWDGLLCIESDDERMMYDSK
jgi:hypothetical protein